MLEDLQNAFSSYQQALQFPVNRQDPNLWYGIGILYDRYNSLEHASQAFLSVVKMHSAKPFNKINEVFFRLGVVYKQQGKYEEALDCFQKIEENPPHPLTKYDVAFQKGHIFELQKNIHKAKSIYDNILAENDNNAKVHQQLGWLYHHNPQLCEDDEKAQSIAIDHLSTAVNIGKQKCKPKKFPLESLFFVFSACSIFFFLYLLLNL